MAIQWHPTNDVVIAVDDPGYGYLITELRSSDRGPGSGWLTLAGPAMGRALRSLTALAAGGGSDSDQVDGLWFMTRVEARVLLPAFQAAVLLAAAGQDRFERVWEERDLAQPREPICTTCGAGHGDSVSDKMRNQWCDEHGHTPFGEEPTPGGWDHAQQRYGEQREAADQLIHLPTHRRR